MKNIKNFKFLNTNIFNEYVNSYGYKLDDVVGFGVDDIRQYDYNVLKTYIIYLNDGDHIYFKVVCFKDFNEYRQSALGFNGNKLLEWYQDADIRQYKLNNRVVTTTK